MIMKKAKETEIHRDTERHRKGPKKGLKKGAMGI